MNTIGRLIPDLSSRAASWLRPPGRERAPMLTLAEASRQMARTPGELVALANAGILRCERENGEVIAVEAVRLRGGHA